MSVFRGRHTRAALARLRKVLRFIEVTLFGNLVDRQGRVLEETLSDVDLRRYLTRILQTFGLLKFIN